MKRAVSLAGIIVAFATTTGGDTACILAQTFTSDSVI